MALRLRRSLREPLFATVRGNSAQGVGHREGQHDADPNHFDGESMFWALPIGGDGGIRTLDTVSRMTL